MLITISDTNDRNIGVLLGDMMAKLP